MIIESLGAQFSAEVLAAGEEHLFPNMAWS